MVWTRRLEKSEWRFYSERISRALAGERAEVEVEVVSLDLGDRAHAESLPPVGLAYDQEGG